MSDKHPLISVVVPLYNHEKYIQETIDSLISQTYPNIELIVIDDGSTDRSFATLLRLKKACEKRFHNVIFQTQKNQGAHLTLNKCISLAHGKYIYCIASDDVAKPRALEGLYNEMKTGRYSFVVGDNDMIDADSKRISWDDRRHPTAYGKGYKTFGSYLQSKKNVVDFASDEFGSYKSLLKRNYTTNGFLIKKEDFDKVGGYQKEAPLEDWYINLQLAKLGKFKFVNQVLLSYRWHDANIMRQKEKMAAAALQTIRYERNLVYASGNRDLIDMFNRQTTKIKHFIKLPPLVCLYIKKDLVQKELILQIMGLKRVLKNKKLP